MSFVRTRRGAAFGLAALISAAGSAGAGPPPYRRHVPANVIKAVEGCWQLAPDEQLTIRRDRSDGLETKSKFDPGSVRPGPSNMAGRRWETAFYWPDMGRLEIGCGPTTQHGQTCLVRPVGDQLEVQLWSNGAEPPKTRTLRSTTLVTRCSAEPHQPRLRAETRK